MGKEGGVTDETRRDGFSLSCLEYEQEKGWKEGRGKGRERRRPWAANSGKFLAGRELGERQKWPLEKRKQGPASHIR